MLIGRKPGLTTLAVWDTQGHYEDCQVRVAQSGREQVMLNVTVAEVDRTRMENQGVDLSLLFIGIGVNLKMLLALLLSGFFMRPGWWTKGLLMIFILPWAVPALPSFISIHWMLNGEWGLLNNALYILFDVDGPSWLNSRWLALGSAVCSHVWKWLPFWTVILLAGRMSIPQEIYDAAKVDGATGLRNFTHVTFPLLSGLYLVLTLLATIFLLGDFNTVTFITGGGPANSTHLLATLGIRDAFDLANPRLGVAVVMSGAADTDPTGDHPNAQAENLGGTAVSTITVDTRPASAATRPSERMRRTARRWRYLTNAGAAVLSAVLLVWTLTPIYNIIMVSLRGRRRRVQRPSLAAASVRRRLLDRLDPGLLVSRIFLAPVRQQRLCRRDGDLLRIADRLADQLLYRADAHPQRLADHQRGTVDLCDPGVVPGDPVLPDHAALRAEQQPLVGHRRDGDLRDTLRDLHLLRNTAGAFRSNSTSWRGSTAHRRSRSISASICR